MRLALVFCLCVVAFGFRVRDLALEHRGETISKLLNTHKLFSFDAVKVSETHKLQGTFDAAACGQAWGMLAGSLAFNATDVCTQIPLVFRGVNDWNVGANQYFLDAYCKPANGCVQRYTALYQNMRNACGGFATRFAASPQVLGDQADQVARTIKALVELPCLNDVVASFDAPGFVHPLSQTPVPSLPYTNYYYWTEFARLTQLRIDDIQSDNDLMDVCNNRTETVIKLLSENGLSQLALAARQAQAYCLKKTVAGEVVYCARKVQALRVRSADPAFSVRLKTLQATREDLDTLCDDCVGWVLQLSTHIMKTLEAWNSTAFNQTILDQLEQSSMGLFISCDKDGDTYCLEKLAKYPLDTLSSRLISCVPNGCDNTKKVDYCRSNLTMLYQDIKCCLATFQRALPLLNDAAKGLVATILPACGFNEMTTPRTCSQKKVKIWAPLKNVAIDYIQTFSDDDLKTWWAATLGLDKQNIDAIICWAKDAMNGDNSTICNVTFTPAFTAAADTFVANFADRVASGAVRFALPDVADLGGDARIDSDAPTQDPTDFQSSSETSCIMAKPPVNYSMNPTTGECEGLCTNGVQDEDETDVDCGGSGCPTCAQGKKCIVDTDCGGVDQNYVCKQSICGTSSAVALFASPLLFLLSFLAVSFM